MKYLLLIAIVLLVVWALQRHKTDAAASRKAPAAKRGEPPSPTEIVECRRCALHLPRAEAVAGQRGLYCSEAHRLEIEGG